MDINEMADKVMAILRKLEEDTKAATREGGQSSPPQEQPQASDSQSDAEKV